MPVVELSIHVPLYNILSSYTEAATMNFNIYLDDETGRQLNRLAKRAGESRNALVREAVRTS